MTLMRIPFPAPDLAGTPPCGTCDGAGLTGETFTMETDGPAALVVEAFCPMCGGCGRAAHDGCGRRAHGLEPDLGDEDPEDDPEAWWDDDQDDDGDEDETPEGACPSCQGREWYPVQGFTGDGDDPNAAMIVLRMPCGCTEGRAVEVDGR